MRRDIPEVVQIYMELRPLPQQKLVMTQALAQSLKLLQMSRMELEAFLEQEVEENPLLEMRKKSGFTYSDEVAAAPSLYESLLAQIREHFDGEEQQEAVCLLHLLDERGFLTEPVKNEPLLKILQTFDPPGIFARDLGESFLLQLQRKGKEASLAYLLVERCFSDLLQGRYKALQKKLGVEDLSEPLRELRLLSMRPAACFHTGVAAPIRPDFIVEKTVNGWNVSFFEETVEIRNEYMQEESLREFRARAKWLCSALSRRKMLLKALMRMLVIKQAPFLRGGKLAPFTAREAAEKLGVHESTLSRALSGKYVATPVGLFSMRSLLTVNAEARLLLKKLIAQEDKKHPLTDDQLANLLQVARRTVAKYRAQLKIGSSARRRHSCRSRDGGIQSL